MKVLNQLREGWGGEKYMGKKEFKVFATDGENTWEIFYITQNPKGDFYYGPVDTEFGKITRHVSGKSHYKGKDSYHPLGYGQRLDSFEYIEELPTKVVIGTRMLGAPTVTNLHESRKIEGSILVDAQRFPNRIGIRVYLLPNKDDCELEKLLKLLPPASDFKIFSETTPRLMIVVYPTILG